MTKKKDKETQRGDVYGNLKLEELPDEIIVHILSLLSLKDAAASSILSSRWRYFWRFTRLMSLNFDFDLTENHGSYARSYGVRHYMSKKRNGYIDWVNTVVNQHLGDIKSLRVCFFLRHKHRIHVDKWIKFAMTSKSLERLELDLSPLYGGFLYHYSLFHELFSVNFVGFKSLKVISLKSVSVSGEDVEYFLSNAPLLERLVVHDSPNLVRLRVCGQSLALKYLEIIKCEKLTSVEICEVNIVSLYFYGQIEIEASNFILRNVPLLVELFVNFCCCSSNFKRLFSDCLSQIEVLRMIDVHREMDDHKYPILPNVKHLHFELYPDEYSDDGGLTNLRYIIEAFPSLEKLVVHAPFYVPPEMKFTTLRYRKVSMWKAPKCLHYRLKEVEVLEYSSKYGDIDRVLYLIKNTVGLQRIVINCKYNHPRRIMKTKPQLVEDEEFSRRHAMTQLRPRVPSNIQFLCL